jgi:hypothetical protein
MIQTDKWNKEGSAYMKEEINKGMQKNPEK